MNPRANHIKALTGVTVFGIIAALTLQTGNTFAQMGKGVTRYEGSGQFGPFKPRPGKKPPHPNPPPKPPHPTPPKPPVSAFPCPITAKAGATQEQADACIQATLQQLKAKTGVVTVPENRWNYEFTLSAAAFKVEYSKVCDEKHLQRDEGYARFLQEFLWTQDPQMIVPESLKDTPARAIAGRVQFTRGDWAPGLVTLRDPFKTEKEVTDDKGVKHIEGVKGVMGFPADGLGNVTIWTGGMLTPKADEAVFTNAHSYAELYVQLPLLKPWKPSVSGKAPNGPTQNLPLLSSSAEGDQIDGEKLNGLTITDFGPARLLYLIRPIPEVNVCVVEVSFVGPSLTFAAKPLPQDEPPPPQPPKDDNKPNPDLNPGPPPQAPQAPAQPAAPAAEQKKSQASPAAAASETKKSGGGCASTGMGDLTLMFLAMLPLLWPRRSAGKN